MLKPSVYLLLGGAGTACGFAGLGLALYAGSTAQAAAAALFAGVGFVAGLACGALQARLGAAPAASAVPLAPQALAGRVRETLASAGAERAERSGSAADRRPSAADLASAALAGAAASAAARVAAPGAAEAGRFASSRFGA